jgi:hypothetical protein
MQHIRGGACWWSTDAVVIRDALHFLNGRISFTAKESNVLPSLSLRRSYRYEEVVEVRKWWLVKQGVLHTNRTRHSDDPSLGSSGMHLIGG